MALKEWVRLGFLVPWTGQWEVEKAQINLFVFDLVSQPGRINVLRFSSGQRWR